MTDYSWAITKGDSDYISISVINADTNQPVNITDSTIYFTVKKSSADLDESAVIQKVITEHVNATGGLSKIELSSDDTDLDIGRYIYDIVIAFLSGERQHLVTPSAFVISQTVKEVKNA